jgi:uncharacterized repeat protein (TIGR01451 family)
VKTLHSLAAALRICGALMALLLGIAGSAWAQVCAVPQNNGTNVTSTGGQVVNGYFSPSSANVTYTAGTTPTIGMGNARGSTTWVTGDLALIIQMQCADLDRTDTDTYGDGVAGRPAHGYLETPSGSCKAGQYEYVPAGVGTNASSFVAGAPLQYTYVQADPTGSSTRRSFQIVRVPQYGDFTLGGTLSGLAWDGLNGGVIALDVAKTLNFAGQTIDISAQGFRGAGGRQSTGAGNNPYRHPASGAVVHAGKAEGIAGTPRLLFLDSTPFDRNDVTGTVIDVSTATYVGYPGTGTTANFDFARGAPGNAGGGGQYFDGGYHNGGGGGGANGGAGGRGGFGWRSAGWAGVLADYSNIETVTGQHLAAFGGAPFGGAGLARVVMGGGGGAGDQNGNSGGILGRMSGGSGGGIVLIRAGALSGSGTIDVRGGVGNHNPLNDAAGAGAAGGSVIVVSPNWTSGVLTVNAQGGDGGDSWIGGGSAHSGGGGGGGGVVILTGSGAVNRSGGSNGITNVADAPPGGADHGAMPGTEGVFSLVPESSDPVSNSGYKCLPQANLGISKSASPSTISVGQTTQFTLTLTNSGPQTGTNSTVIDGLPAGLGTLTWVSSSVAGGASIGATSIASVTTFTGTVTLPVGSTITIVLQAVGASATSAINSASIAAANTITDANLSNNVATASVVIGPTTDLSISKAASTPTLALGATTLFTLTVSNLGPTAVTGARIVDVIPANLGTVSFVSASGVAGATLTANSLSGNTFTGTATLPVNSTLTIALRAVGGTTSQVINSANVSPPSGVTDAISSNNTGTAQVTIGGQVDLSISKSANPSTLADSQTTVFSLVVSNAGPSTATNAVVSDVLPSGLNGATLISTSGAAGGTVTATTSSSSRLTSTVTLPPGSSVTINFSALASGVGSQVNNASVTAPVSVVDINTANNSASATVVIPVPAALAISKSNNTSTLAAGSTTSYVIVVSNAGPNAANNALLKDPAATGLQCTGVSCSASGGAICPSTSVATLQGAGVPIATFPAVSSLTFTLTCGVTATGQ